MYTIEDPIKRTITYLVDTFIYILYICLQLCGKTTPIKGPLDTLSFRKILVIRIDHIGDVLLTTPVHSALKERYPKAKIYSMVGSWAACIHNHNPHIDATIVYDAPWWKRERSNARFRLNDIFDLIRVVRLIRTEKFDLVIDPRGDFRHLFFFGYCTNAKYLLSYNRSGGKYLLSHAVNYDRYLNEIDKNFTLLAPLGIKNVQKNTDVFISKDETQWCNNFLSDHNLQNKLIVIISPGSRLQLKMLPIEKFISLSSWLIEQCHNVAIVYIGAKKNADLSSLIKKDLNKTKRIYDLIGRTTILQDFALLQHSHLILTNDGPIAHMTSSLDVPTIVFFGPTMVDQFKPHGTHIHSLSKNFACSPCVLNNCSLKKSSDQAMCMDAIEVDDIKHIIQENVDFNK